MEGVKRGQHPTLSSLASCCSNLQMPISRLLSEDAGLQVLAAVLPPRHDSVSLQCRRLPAEPRNTRAPLMQKESGILGLNTEKFAGDLTDKLRLLDHLAHLENDVIETKRKRSFSGGNTPLDRLSVGTMETKNKQRHHTEEGGRRKVVELPRRRVSAPIDRIGVGRLPSNRG
ncbi:osteocrin [Arapaima gigas]